MSNHSELTDQSIHTPLRWTWANTAARDAETDFASEDINKIGLQSDDNTFWLLEDLTPTFIQVGHVPITIEFTVGAEVSNVINVACQINQNDTAVTAAYVLQAWLSSSLSPPAIVTTAPNGGIAIGTDGVIMSEFVTDKYFLLYFDATGQADIDVTETGTATFYLNVLLPSGTITSSGVMSF